MHAALEPMIPLAVTADLGFTLVGWPPGPADRAKGFLGHFLLDARDVDSEVARLVIRWRTTGSEGVQDDAGTPLMAPWEWRPRGALHTLAGRVLVRVDTRGRAAELLVDELDASQEQDAVWRLLPAVMGELAAYHGWLLMHAAAVGWGGRAMVLPGSGGCGKTTVYLAAAEMGWPVLSDDLVWVRPGSGASGLPWAAAFPRGGPETGLPMPSIREMPLGVLVFPGLASDGRREVRRLPATDLLRRLNECCVALGSPGSRTARFQAMSWIAGRIPGFSWQRPRLLPPE